MTKQMVLLFMPQLQRKDLFIMRIGNVNAALALALVLLMPGCVHKSTQVTGDSLVLAGTTAGNLGFTKVLRKSVRLRSTYETDAKNAVIYEEGRDYIVNYKAGSIARTENSRIPDFETNILFGKKEFNHTEFPGYGNAPFFVFADYATRTAGTFAPKSEPSDALALTAKKLQAGGPFKIIGFGDSITNGGEASALHLRFQQRYGAYLGEKFPKAEISVENGATGGDATRQGLARLEEKVLTRDPDLVLLGFGMNDHNVNSVPVDEFEENLITMVKRIREATGADVLLFSAFPPHPDWKFGSHRMEHYAAATKRAAKRSNAAFADVHAVWANVLKRKDASSLLGNNINHPNDFGHALYFEALKSVEF
jgi:acyl-CoA thioesterase I